MVGSFFCIINDFMIVRGILSNITIHKLIMIGIGYDCIRKFEAKTDLMCDTDICNGIHICFTHLMTFNNSSISFYNTGAIDCADQIKRQIIKK